MNASQPPRFPTWLLKRLATGPRRESLAGDLVEQYRRGRSTSWYWRQALAAVVADMVAEFQAHKVLGVRAVLVGGVAQWVLLSWLRTPIRMVLGSTGRAMWNWTIEHGFDGLRVLWFGKPALPGVLVLLVMCVVVAVAGRLVAYLHRAHRPAMVMLFALSVPVWSAAWLSTDSSLPLRYYWDAFAFSNAVFLFVALPVSALCGGL